MRPTLASRVALGLLGVALAGTAVRGEQGPPPRVIHYERDALTVRLAKVPVGDVLDEIGRQADARIRGQVRDPQEVSAEFEAVPLDEALHRLLGEQNFALVYGKEGRLKTVRLLGGPQAAAAPASPPATVVAPPAPPAADSVVSLMAKHRPIPVSGHLSEIVGGPQASLLQLVDLGTHHADATVRAEAAHAVLATVDGDGALRSSVVAQLNATDDAALADLLRNAAGDHAEEVAMQVLAGSRAPEIRNKASAVLQQLRAGG